MPSSLNHVLAKFPRAFVQRLPCGRFRSKPVCSSIRTVLRCSRQPSLRRLPSAAYAHWAGAWIHEVTPRRYRAPVPGLYRCKQIMDWEKLETETRGSCLPLPAWQFCRWGWLGGQGGVADLTQDVKM